MERNVSATCRIEKAKASFLGRELLALTLGATAQRSKLYRENLDEAARKPFQQSLRDRLQEIVASRQQTETDEEHLANIERLAASLSEQHATVLAGGRMKLGHAQKALNLYLKYRWCEGLALQPPHFPVDAIILKEIPGYKDGKTAWTKLDSRKEYLDIIAAARRVAITDGLSLPEWELMRYRRR